jgi:hypothetical protein
MKNVLEDDIAYSIEYLTNGGLGEVYGMAEVAASMKQPKVQMDTSMAMAMCRLLMDAGRPVDWSSRDTGEQGESSSEASAP